jgi:hypothetical protein
LKYHDYLGTGWGGKVFSVPSEEVDAIYRDNAHLFSDTGLESFLKTLKIPPSFFAKQTVRIQHDLVVAQKEGFREGKNGQDNEMLLLMNENKISWASRRRGVGWQDPNDLLDMNEASGWATSHVDVDRGLLRYRNLFNDDDRDHYVPAVFTTIPLMYDGKVSFEVGLFKVRCTNGLVDKVSADTFGISADTFSADMFSPFVSGIRNAMDGMRESYTKFLNFLQENHVSVEKAAEWIKENKGIPKNIRKEALRHFDLVEGKRKVDALLPDNIETLYDVVDTLTYYSARQESNSRVSKGSSETFNLFYKLWNRKTKEELTPFDIKAIAKAA